MWILLKGSFGMSGRTSAKCLLVGKAYNQLWFVHTLYRCLGEGRLRDIEFPGYYEDVQLIGLDQWYTWWVLYV